MSNTIDISKIKVGDEVELRLVVTEVEPPGYSGDQPIRVRADWNEHDLWPYASEITAHHPTPPKPLAVGDKVRAAAGDILEVVALKRKSPTCGEEYAVWDEDSGYSAVPASDVESWERVQ